MRELFGDLSHILKKSAWEERLLYLYTVAMPFIDYFLFTFLNKRILYADFIFLSLFIVWVAKYISGKVKIDFTHLKFSLILLPVLFAPSFFSSSDLSGSIAEFVGLVYLIILFIAAANIINNHKKLRLALYLYFLTSVLLSLFGLGLFFRAILSGNLSGNSFLSYGSMESMAHHFPRIDLAFESANMALAYLHIAFIFGIFLFLTENRKSVRPIIALSLAVILITAFFTGSRRFTGLLLTIFIILCWYGRGKVSSILKYLSFLAFLGFLAVSIVTSIWVVFPVKVIKDGAAREVAIKANYAHSIHYLLPAVSLNMFKKHPFIGAGLGTFNNNFKENVDWGWLESSFGFEAYPDYVKLVKERRLNFDPHSVIFGTLAETGLLGLTALIYFLAVYAWKLIKRFKISLPGYPENILSGCLLAGFIGFICNAFTLDILSMRHFWFMLAIGLAGYGQNKKD